MVKSLTLFKMELLTSLRYKVNFFGTLLSVLLCMLSALVMLIDRDISIFGFENAMQYSGYLIIANAYWCMAESFWDFTFVMRNKMREGILEETLMLPLNTVQFMLGWACNSIFITRHCRCLFCHFFYWGCKISRQYLLFFLWKLFLLRQVFRSRIC